jgi:hypothetical protein
MKPFGKLLLLTLGSGLFAVALPSIPSHPDDRCKPVQGTINSVFTTLNCTSPVGLDH